jgi:hypothetical protein
MEQEELRVDRVEGCVVQRCRAGVLRRQRREAWLLTFDSVSNAPTRACTTSGNRIRASRRRASTVVCTP